MFDAEKLEEVVSKCAVLGYEYHKDLPMGITEFKTEFGVVSFSRFTTDHHSHTSDNITVMCHRNDGSIYDDAITVPLYIENNVTLDISISNDTLNEFIYNLNSAEIELKKLRKQLTSENA